MISHALTKEALTELKAVIERAEKYPNAVVVLGWDPIDDAFKAKTSYGVWTPPFSTVYKRDH